MKKGPLAEAQVVACLQEHGWPYAERRVQGGRNDRGDVAGIPGVCIEVKNSPQYVQKLAVWLREALDEASHGGHFDPDRAVVWHKRQGFGSPLDWYVTMTGRDFLALLAEYTRED